MTRPTPLIGIAIPSDYFQRTPLTGNSGDYRSVYEIKDALERAGAASCFLFPGENPAIDGLVLPGGGDIDPSFYGQSVHSLTGELDPQSDQHQLSWAAVALKSDLPVLGICRGMQVLNVAAGGDLVQHIEHGLGHDPDAVRRDASLRRYPVHSLTVKKKTRLAMLLGSTQLEVNSMHHQAVSRVGNGLRATAWAEDGLVEALESENGRQVGVQFHPEDLRHSRPVFEGLFRGLVEQAASH